MERYPVQTPPPRGEFKRYISTGARGASRGVHELRSQPAPQCRPRALGPIRPWSAQSERHSKPF